MALKSLTDLKNFFKTNLIPTQQQFWDMLDSFRHKSDKVAATDIDGLTTLLAAKASNEAFNSHTSAENAHAGLFGALRTWVESQIEGVVVDSENLGALTPLSTIPDTINVHGFAVEEGTYANCGGVVVPATSYAFISRVAGVWKITVTELDVSGKLNVSDVLNILNSTETTKAASADALRRVDEKTSKILPWVDGAYPVGTQRNHLGIDWYLPTTAAVLGDVPGTSSKWVDRLSGYVAPKSIFDSVNLFNENDLSVGHIDRTAGNISVISSGATSHWIGVTALEPYYLSGRNTTTGEIRFKDAVGTILKANDPITGIVNSSFNYAINGLIIPPATAVAIQFTVKWSDVGTTEAIQFEKGSAASLYVKYGYGNLKEKYNQLKQSKADPSLVTYDKTVVGGINEISASLKELLPKRININENSLTPEAFPTRVEGAHNPAISTAADTTSPVAEYIGFKRIFSHTTIATGSSYTTYTIPIGSKRPSIISVAFWVKKSEFTSIYTTTFQTLFSIGGTYNFNPALILNGNEQTANITSTGAEYSTATFKILKIAEVGDYIRIRITFSSIVWKVGFLGTSIDYYYTFNGNPYTNKQLEMIDFTVLFDVEPTGIKVYPDANSLLGSESLKNAYLSIKDLNLLISSFNQNLLQQNPLFQKRCAFVGDSITYGATVPLIDAADSNFYPVDGVGKYQNYAYMIAKRTGLKWFNYGISGSTLGDVVNTGVSKNGFSKVGGRYTSMDNSLDYISIMFGWNDAAYGGSSLRDTYCMTNYGNYYVNITAPQKAIVDAYKTQAQWDLDYIGTITDTTNTTFYGAWNIVLQYLINKYPLAKIGLIVPYGSSSGLREAVRIIAKKYGLGYLDLYSESVPLFYSRESGSSVLSTTVNGTNISTVRTNAYLSDGTHPNVSGYKFLSTIIENWMRTL